MNLALEKRKLELLLRTSGQSFTFARYETNRYNEKTDVVVEYINVLGIYHEVRDRIEKVEGSITKYYTVVKPMILGRFIDIQDAIKKGDMIEYRGQTLEVTGVTNLNKYNVYSDISLEVVNSE